MKKVLFMLLTLSLTMASCSSDSVNTVESNQREASSKATSGITQGLQSIRDKVLSDMNYGGKVNYTPKEGVVFYTKSKTNIVIPPHSIQTKDGKDVDGAIVIDYIEIFNKSKMAVANKPTMGLIGGQKGLLVTGGEFYLDIRHNGEQVVIVNPIKVNISTFNSKADPTGMVLWNGDINSDENLTWIPAQPTDLIFENDGTIFGGREGSDMYDVLVNNSSNFGWCNIDRLINFPGTKTKIGVIPPAGFNHTNSSVYLAVQGEDNMLAQFDVFNSGTNTFEEHTGLVPIGLKIHVIFVAEVNGNYVYSILSTTVGNNAIYTIPAGSLITTTSYNQVEAAINALP
ncbi:hypothetical protein [Flavobacterium sp. HSC-61S13]|uniref:hypothetical protein n=1 Tax=Flavobacterium sp. HSC-61S13 TaxID=2910963 RepID=UPI00209DFA20|nr:hypothetical protein [Flavobacterium sp. HSC-61S13]MCP1997329.1 hypothetical protein [Flavobacterium sp. HSC-61S13]